MKKFSLSSLVYLLGDDGFTGDHIEALKKVKPPEEEQRVPKFRLNLGRCRIDNTNRRRERAVRSCQRRLDSGPRELLWASRRAPRRWKGSVRRGGNRWSCSCWSLRSRAYCSVE